MTLYKWIKVLLVSTLVLGLWGCGGFNAADTQFGNLGYTPETPDDLDVPPTSEDPDSYDDEGAGVYLHDVHSAIDALYEKTYFHADIGELGGTPGTNSARQGGSIVLTFEDDDGNKSNRYFTTGGSSYESMEKNYWTKKSDGTAMWRGVFQGRKGALVIVIDGVFMYGDGAGPLDTMAGSVWFRPWQVLAEKKLPTHECVLNGSGLWDCKNQSAPIKQCWYVSLGPYDCRFEIGANGSYVTRLANKYNDTDWVKLGRFNNLNKSQVFHETY